MLLASFPYRLKKSLIFWWFNGVVFSVLLSASFFLLHLPSIYKSFDIVWLKSRMLVMSDRCSDASSLSSAFFNWYCFWRLFFLFICKFRFISSFFFFSLILFLFFLCRVSQSYRPNEYSIAEKEFQKLSCFFFVAVYVICWL